MATIGLGTAAIGRPQYINIRSDKQESTFSLSAFKENSLRVLDDAYEQGIRFYDASPGYGFIEALLQEWMRDKNDPSIVISTKWSLSYEANFDIQAKIHEIKKHSLERLNLQWESSKKLMPALKIYQIHSATLETAVLDNKAILDRLFQLKKNYNLVIGLTTTGNQQVDVLQKAMSIYFENEPLFTSFQCTFNILERSIWSVQEQLNTDGRQLIIKESLANGRLIPNESYPAQRELYAYLLTLAHKYQVGVDAIAIRFCMDSFPHAICLSGASSSEQLRSNLLANSFELQQDEISLLRDFHVKPAQYWAERSQLAWQ